MSVSKEKIHIKLDKYLINKYDSATSCSQRQGWVPLNTIIMANTVMFWGCAFTHSIADQNVPYIPIIFGSVDLTFHFIKWKENQGYWENQRKTQALNAQVVAEYDRYIARNILTCIAVFVMIPNASIFGFFSGEGILSIAAGVLLVSSGYLRCCQYMGPGNYARKRQVNISGASQGAGYG